MISKEAERMWVMGSKALILIVTLLICFLISNSPLLAQSKDRNNPSPLPSLQIKAYTSSIGEVYWYKLTAGPGELYIEMEADCGNRSRCGINVQFILYYKDTQEIINESLSAWGGGGGMAKHISLKLEGKKDFLLSIVPGLPGWATNPGTYMIRFKGAIDLPPEKEER
jgi:hypothetical protein